MLAQQVSYVARFWQLVVASIVAMATKVFAHIPGINGYNIAPPEWRTANFSLIS